jgi:arylformamidase
MIAQLEHKGWHFSVDLAEAKPISVAIDAAQPGPRCFYAPPFRIEPVIADGFVGDIAAGGLVNFKNIFINPHGNGTHTECVGHILDGPYTIHECLTRAHFLAVVLSVTPTLTDNGDQMITGTLLEECWQKTVHGTTSPPPLEALIVRTLPNGPEKKRMDYSGTNPPFFTAEAMHWIGRKQIDHLLTDLPSVDREEDDGLLLAHKAFWGVPDSVQLHKTITELIFVDNSVEDGIYLCTIQIAPFQLDVSPSRICVYSIKNLQESHV